MEKDFVPYELAVKLKAIGFDEECSSYYDLNNKPNFFGADGLMDTHCVQVNRPTFSQAFRWFRERHFYHSINTYHSVSPNKPFGVSIDYLHESGKWDYIDLRGEVEFETYEEAELACLTMLIEIVEGQKDSK